MRAILPSPFFETPAPLLQANQNIRKTKIFQNSILNIYFELSNNLRNFTLQFNKSVQSNEFQISDLHEHVRTQKSIIENIIKQIPSESRIDYFHDDFKRRFSHLDDLIQSVHVQLKLSEYRNRLKTILEIEIRDKKQSALSYLTLVKYIYNDSKHIHKNAPRSNSNDEQFAEIEKFTSQFSYKLDQELVLKKSLKCFSEIFLPQFLMFITMASFNENYVQQVTSRLLLASATLFIGPTLSRFRDDIGTLKSYDRIAIAGQLGELLSWTLKQHGVPQSVLLLGQCIGNATLSMLFRDTTDNI